MYSPTDQTPRSISSLMQKKNVRIFSVHASRTRNVASKESSKEEKQCPSQRKEIRDSS
jgi:hypothetical protein